MKMKFKVFIQQFVFLCLVLGSSFSNRILAGPPPPAPAPVDSDGGGGGGGGGGTVVMVVRCLKLNGDLTIDVSGGNGGNSSGGGGGGGVIYIAAMEKTGTGTLTLTSDGGTGANPGSAGTVVIKQLKEDGTMVDKNASDQWQPASGSVCL